MKNNRSVYIQAAVFFLIAFIGLSCTAQAAGNASDAHKPGKDLHDVYEYVKEVHGYTHGNSYYINVLNEKKVSKEEFHKDQARQDKATGEARAKAEEASKGVAHNKAEIGKTNKIVTRHTGEIRDLQGRATQADLGIAENRATNVAQDKTLARHGSRLDDHDAQFAAHADLHSALNTRLGGAYERLEAHEGRISRLERDMDRNNEAAAIGLAIAGHQFDTKGGFQTAVSVSSVHNREALAIGMGGAISERVFVNVGVASSGNTTGGVVSSTFSW